MLSCYDATLSCCHTLYGLENLRYLVFGPLWKKLTPFSRWFLSFEFQNVFIDPESFLYLHIGKFCEQRVSTRIKWGGDFSNVGSIQPTLELPNQSSLLCLLPSSHCSGSVVHTVLKMPWPFCLYVQLCDLNLGSEGGWGLLPGKSLLGRLTFFLHAFADFSSMLTQTDRN